MQLKDMKIDHQGSQDRISALQDSLEKAQNNIKLLKEKAISLAEEKEILASREKQAKNDLDDVKLRLMTETRDQSNKHSINLEQLKAQLASYMKSNEKMKAELQK